MTHESDILREPEREPRRPLGFRMNPDTMVEIGGYQTGQGPWVSVWRRNTVPVAEEYRDYGDESDRLEG